jgi:lipoprotein-anchoring transpeptidase ErfK/SrfK
VEQHGRAWNAAARWTVRALGLAALALLAGCGNGSHQGVSSDAGPSVSAALITVTPGDGASQVPVTGGVGVTVRSGRLSRVVLRDDLGDAVPGALAADGESWQPTAELRAETRYTLDAVAADASGSQAAKHAVFTTLVPEDSFIAFYSPEDGSTVGVGTEVSLRFNRAVTDRAEVRRAVRVTAVPAVPVAGHWFGDHRLDLRPEHFWKPGTRVTLTLRLKGVEGAPGVYGTQRRTVAFTIGRAQVSTADTVTDRLTVRRDGKLLRTLPISAGGPGHASYDGIMVISEMDRVTRLNSATVGLGSEYDIPDVPHALRLTDSGTFVHGVYWRPASVFGSRNTSHGCVGLYDVKGGTSRSTPAGWFYDHSMPGDVVRVTGSDGGTVAPDNGTNGWNMTWARWLG